MRLCAARTFVQANVSVVREPIDFCEAHQRTCGASDTTSPACETIAPCLQNALQLLQAAVFNQTK
jgi:hypothetical protein